jgi:release factor glutamine methyltransferase
LSAIYDKYESASIASVVLQNITGIDRMQRVTKNDESLHEGQLHKLIQVAQRLSLSEPVQYVLGEAPFGSMNLFVNNTVLIPRPETEELVEWVVNDVKQKGLPVFEKGPTDADVTDSLKILDVGTGSGCIALALKKQMPRAEVWGCDVSDEALNVARRNGSQLDVRVDFQGINFLDVAQQKGLPTVDIVVSNPPYIPEAGKKTLHSNVVQFEPHTSLYVPDDDALIFYKALAHFGQHRLYSNGTIYCEIHEDMGKDVIDLFKNEGYTPVEIRKDMQGKDRMVKAVKL